MPDIPQDILIRASEGDLESFEVIYKAMAGFVYNVAFRVVGNREDAQEITQEVFLMVYRKLKEFRFESSLKTWMYRITVNLAINFAKKESRKKVSSAFGDKFEEVPVFEAKAHIEQEHNRKIIEDLLNVLNPDQRVCVVLRNMEGLSYQKIAETLQININTVRSRLKRARERLLTLRKKVSV
jgi:RNA polymerase sigma-70 factor (ECF subfamily)